ncbi:MAG: glycosyltransferase [Cyclobacteriaceae bacterium]
MLLSIVSVYLIILLVYLYNLNVLLKAWEPIPKDKSPGFYKDGFTLLIPFRDELKNLGRLMANLSGVLPGKAEVIFIDDQSEDGSLEWVKKEIKALAKGNWRCISSNGSGKKAALNTGILASQFDILVTTDADVILNKGWPSSLISSFSEPTIQLVAGPVLVQGKESVFAHFQLAEWASILLVTRASFQWRNPVMCSAANLAFRKSAFFSVGGYQGNEQFLSGDDEFLLKKVHQYYGGFSTKYIIEKNSLVQTFAFDSIIAWINQRARWAGKWKLHGFGIHALSAMGLVIFSAIHLSTFIWVLVSLKWGLAILIYWGMKIGMERKVLGRVLNSYDRDLPLGSYIWTSVLHPALILITLPYALFGKFSWKGRKN